MRTDSDLVDKGLDQIKLSFRGSLILGQRVALLYVVVQVVL